jgi:hypothetical protein
MVDMGSALFLLAFGVIFTDPRVGAAVGLVSSLLCFPLYLYFTAPDFTAPAPFHEILGFGHECKVQPSEGLHKWALTGLLTLAIATYLCMRGLAATSREQIPERG